MHLKAPAFAELGEALAHRADLRAIPQRAQGQHLGGRIRPHRHHAETILMQEFERRITLAEFSKQPPHAEIALAHIGVVEEDDRAAGQLGQPVFKIRAHGVVAVAAVDVQQIDAAVLHVLQRRIEGAAQHLGERGITLFVEAAQVIIDRFIVVPGVLVALPRVHRVAARIEPALHHGFAEPGVGHAVMRAEFHQQTRAGGGDDPVRERQMCGPCAVITKPGGTPEQRRQIGRQQCRDHSGGFILGIHRVGYSARSHARGRRGLHRCSGSIHAQVMLGLWNGSWSNTARHVRHR